MSQRIVNQEIHVGLEEDVAVPRWFARFLADGTANTTIKCETGRNPTGAPSASEIETTTITLPFGLTTAALLDYRVELLTEAVRFYVNGVRVAEHVRVLPHQHDEMTSHVEIRNGGTAPASSTTVVVDYVTGKNHNKLEVGVMSDAEQIVAVAVPLVPFAYNQTGVIAVNTDLMVLDCRQLRSLSIQCRSMGTAGVVTVQWSNEPTFASPITATLLSEAGAISTTFNAAVLRYTNVLAAYCRLRLTTATTGGTTTLEVWGSQNPIPVLVGTQPVSGTVTANIGTGSLAAGTNAVGDVGIQYRANATGAATVSNFVSAATANPTVIKASAGRLLGYQLTNNATAVRYVKLHNSATAPTAGAGVVGTIGIPPNGGTVTMQLPGGMAFSTGIAITTVTGAATTDATAVALNDIAGTFFFA